MMRIAIGILGLALGMLVLLQSCAISIGSDVVGDATTSEAGGVGIIMGILYFIGGAFAFGLPLVSLIVFALATLAGLTIGTGVFADLQIWAYVALALAVLSFVAWRKGRRKTDNAGASGA
ncbi:hypothetical protein [Mesorhizobium sp. CAU 1741]|uniref:hypothetical protein n=1 Tax=Mesorhizobium sp. CAU 1741 TaxID=3140366 RepID=UPI00325C1936